LLACGGASSGQGETTPTNDNAATTSKPAPPPTASSYLNALPAGSNLVIYVSASSLVDSTLWTRYGDKLMKQLSQEQEYVKTAEKCGVDFVKDLDWVILAGNTTNDDFTLIVKGFSADVVECAFRANDGVVETSGSISKVTEKGKESFLGWLDADVVITGAKAENNRAWVAERLERKGVSEWGSEDDSVTAWLSVVPDQSMAPSFQALAGGSPARIRGDATVTAAFDGRIEMIMADEQHAKKAVQNIEAAMSSMKSAPPFSDFMSTISVAAAGPSAAVSINMDPPTFEKFLTMVEQNLLPMLGAF
jgi:hypothetical protein